MARSRFYTRASMAELARNATALGIHHDTSLASTTIPLPKLRFGVPFLDHWPIREEPGGAHWREPSYETYSPWTFTFSDAVLHSAAGIVCVGEYVVAETLNHTDPDLHGYRPSGAGVWIDRPGAALPGTHVSALAGSPESYYHALIDGFGRLSVVPLPVMEAANGFLATRDPPATVAWLQSRLPLARTAVPDAGGLAVERLVLAGPSDTSCNYHPSLAAWFDSFGDSVATDGFAARRFYIDRRHALSRPLANEVELIGALERIGIRPIALESLGAEAQVALFRSAELVVSPHGAGLGNLVFARPGCQVIEIQMDAYCHWGFRRLAALRGLTYDCVVGRAARPWPDRAGAIHAASWTVSVPHVMAAVEAAIAPA